MIKNRSYNQYSTSQTLCSYVFVNLLMFKCRSTEVRNAPSILLQVAMATAAKAKLLLRELKTVKADLAFAKQRCSQLEEENRILREAREKGDNPADDDMVRLQFSYMIEHLKKKNLNHLRLIWKGQKIT